MILALRCVWIGLGAQLRRAALDAAQLQRVGHSAMDHRHREGLRQPVRLRARALAGDAAVPDARPRLQQPAQRSERVRRLPALRRRLIQGVALHLERRKTMERVEREGSAFAGSWMPGDLLGAEQGRRRVHTCRSPSQALGFVPNHAICSRPASCASRHVAARRLAHRWNKGVQRREAACHRIVGERGPVLARDAHRLKAPPFQLATTPQPRGRLAAIA